MRIKVIGRGNCAKTARANGQKCAMRKKISLGLTTVYGNFGLKKREKTYAVVDMGPIIEADFACTTGRDPAVQFDVFAGCCRKARKGRPYVMTYVCRSKF